MTAIAYWRESVYYYYYYCITYKIDNLGLTDPLFYAINFQFTKLMDMMEQNHVVGENGIPQIQENNHSSSVCLLIIIN
jgi:hypothetical protein